jgi:hypothetical protein
MKKLLLLGLLFLVGCDDFKEKMAENNKELASGGTVVGVFPDGAKVRSYELNVPNRGSQQFFVIEQKSENDKTILINGQLYAPAENE